MQKGLSKFEETLAQQHEERRMRRKAASLADRPVSDKKEPELGDEIIVTSRGRASRKTRKKG